MTKPLSPRVALLTSSLGGGGAERVVLELATGFTQRGLSVDLVLMNARGEFLRLVPDGVRVIELNTRRMITFIADFLFYTHRERPVAVLSTLLLPDIAALIAKVVWGKRLRVIVRQATTFSSAYEQAGFKLRLHMRFVKWLMPFADWIVTGTEGVASDLRSQTPRSSRKVVTIGNPVVAPTIAEQACLAVEHPWFDDGAEPVILATGRFVPPKDYPTLLKAFSEVANTRAVRLVILGQGPGREDLLELAARLNVEDRVDLPGFDVNPFRYMGRASVFVLSSRFEGFPNVLVQAMACGAPVVSTDCPSGPNEILEGGRWGRLVPVGDWRAMARAIEDTLDDPLPAGKLKARAAVYSVEASVDRYYELLMGNRVRG